MQQVVTIQVTSDEENKNRVLDPGEGIYTIAIMTCHQFTFSQLLLIMLIVVTLIQLCQISLQM